MHARRSIVALVACFPLALLGLAPATAAAQQPSPHSQEAFDPFDDYTMRWTRADAQRILEQSSSAHAPGENSLPEQLTMPDIPVDFPVMRAGDGRQVWVWDTWPLTDARGNQYSYNGWTVIFSLTADPYAGYTFDDRHWHARIGFWFRRAGDDGAAWTYGGHLFADGVSPGEAEWSGSTRLLEGNEVRTFYTATATGTPPTARIIGTPGQIHSNASRVWFTGFRRHTVLLEPDGSWYQTGTQNPFFSFRDPFTFRDPAHPRRTFMVFEGNTGGDRGTYACTPEDLGDSGEDPLAVTASGAGSQVANIGLAVATDRTLNRWRFLAPILSANCVNDQTERPQFVIRRVDGEWRYYLFTISHAFTYAAGVRGPDGVYGFVGDGIRSDFEPLNGGSGLVLGNPTDLDLGPRDPNQNPRAFQAYSHYVMPGWLVESFIDNVEGRRGGTLAPTVRLLVDDTETAVDRSVGAGGLLGYGLIPANVNRRWLSDPAAGPLVRRGGDASRRER